jgi:hypothetical protein
MKKDALIFGLHKTEATIIIACDGRLLSVTDSFKTKLDWSSSIQVLDAPAQACCHHRLRWAIIIIIK